MQWHLTIQYAIWSEDAKFTRILGQVMYVREALYNYNYHNKGSVVGPFGSGAAAKVVKQSQISSLLSRSTCKGQSNH